MSRQRLDLLFYLTFRTWVTPAAACTHIVRSTVLSHTLRCVLCVCVCVCVCAVSYTHLVFEIIADSDSTTLKT